MKLVAVLVMLACTSAVAVDLTQYEEKKPAVSKEQSTADLNASLNQLEALMNQMTAAAIGDCVRTLSLPGYCKCMVNGLPMNLGTKKLWGQDQRLWPSYMMFTVGGDFAPGMPEYKKLSKELRGMADMVYAARNQCAAKLTDIK